MVVVEAPSGRIIAAREADRRWYPASLAKLLTLTATFDALDEGKLTPDQILPVSARAAAQPPTKLGLRAGQTIEVKEAIRAVAVVSANDAAVVLAEAIGGTEPEFVKGLNGLARKLGLVRTRLRNASGLPGPGQWTTARDMARLALVLGARHAERLSVLRAGRKTGFTCDAGYNVVLRTSERVAVVLGAHSRSARDTYARGLVRRNAPTVNTSSVWATPAVSTPLPPRRLGPGTCHPKPSWRPVTHQTKITGWGIFLGNYADQQHARDAANHTRALLPVTPIVPTLLPRQVGERPTWKLLMTGLSAADAGRACRQLNGKAQLCIAQSPARMAMTGYPNQ